MKVAARLGVATCKQGDVVTEFDKCIDEPRNDPLGATVELWWYALGERSNLGHSRGLAICIKWLFGRVDKPN